MIEFFGRDTREPARLFPIYDDTATMLKTALDENGESERIVQIAALDPFLTIDLLYRGTKIGRTSPSTTTAISGRPAYADGLSDLTNDPTFSYSAYS